MKLEKGTGMIVISKIYKFEVWTEIWERKYPVSTHNSYLHKNANNLNIIA